MKKIYSVIVASLLAVHLAANGSELNGLLKHEQNGGQQNPVLMFDIYKAYNKLEGEHNLKQAYIYLKKAANLGHGEASYMLYQLLKDNPAVEFSSKEENDPQYWLRKANEFNHFEAGLELKYLALNNPEIGQDELDSTIEALKAFADREPKVWLKLSKWYRQDDNPHRDLVAATSYAEAFQKKGDENGLADVELAYIEKSKKEPDLERVMSHLRQGVNKGNAQAHKDLGILMSEGDYNSRKMAYELLVKAYKMGEHAAKPYIEEILNRNRTPIIYNIPLYRAERPLVKERMGKLGVYLTESKGYLDYYGGGNINGAEQLIAAYDMGEAEVLAQLSFIFKNDTIRYARMFNAISEKYGVPDNQGRINFKRNRTKFGKSLNNEYVWEQGAATIRLSRDEQEKGLMKLEYLIEPYAQQMAKKLKEAYQQGAEKGVLKNAATY